MRGEWRGREEGSEGRAGREIEGERKGVRGERGGRERERERERK